MILDAQNGAQTSQNHFVSPTHLFLAILQKSDPDSSTGALLLGANLKIEEARLYVAATIEPPSVAPGSEPTLTKEAKQVIEWAADEARRAGDSFIEPEHLLLACLRAHGDKTLLETLAPLAWNVEVLRATRREMRSQSASQPNQNPLNFLTGDAQKAVDAAYNAMRATFCGRISSAHLLLGLLEHDNHAVEMLEEIGAPVDELKRQTRALIRSDEQLATPDKRFDKGAKRALDRAKFEAQSRGYSFIGTDHLLLGLLPQRATTKETLTWGKDVGDEAARVLENVNRQLRDLAGPTRAPKTKTLFDAHAMPMWTLGFVFETTCCFAGFGLRHPTPEQATAASWAVTFGMSAVFVLLLFLVQSKLKPQPKPRTLWIGMIQNFFLGVLMGFGAGLVVALNRSN